jgi:hypothetical protein
MEPCRPPPKTRPLPILAEEEENQAEIDGLNRSRGEKAVTVSGYWQKPLTVTALTVIKFH